jgi:hypothetical protein
MRRPVLGTLFALACVSILFLPSTASAIPLHVHRTVDVVGGVEVEEVKVVHIAPADDDQDGLRNRDDKCDDDPYSAGNAGCTPPPPPEPEPEPEPVVTESVAPATEPTYSSGGYAIPSYIVECESGGDYTAQNPSGAYGAYQIMPGTADAYGCDLSTPAGQDACAAEIYATEGSSPWVCG